MAQNFVFDYEMHYTVSFLHIMVEVTWMACSCLSLLQGANGAKGDKGEPGLPGYDGYDGKGIKVC